MRERLEDTIFRTGQQQQHARRRAARYPGQGSLNEHPPTGAARPRAGDGSADEASVGAAAQPAVNGAASGGGEDDVLRGTGVEHAEDSKHIEPAHAGGSGGLGTGPFGGGSGSGSSATPPGRSGRIGGPGNGGSGVRRTVSLVAAGALVAGGGYLAWDMASPIYHSLTAPKDYTGPGTAAVSFVVKQGESGSTIAANLAKAGIVQTSGAFSSALTENPGAQIQPGTYALKKQMKASDALAALRNPASRSVKKVAIIEGMWKTQVFAALSKATGQPLSAYTAAAAKPSALGLPAAAKGNLEGYLFPATYEFQPSDNATVQLRALVSKTKDTLAQLEVPPSQQQRIVTMASIIEAEAGAETDRPKVAQVLVNRLKKGMRLQLDSTVSYGVQRRSITTTDAERADRNGWNTYVVNGLPSGPIGNPGASSLKAAMNPSPGPWLFFVTVNPETGLTKFATSGAEHNRYVAEFQSWCQAHKGVC